jgi:uncharacterized protein
MKNKLANLINFMAILFLWGLIASSSAASNDNGKIEASSQPPPQADLKILFIGDQGGHQPARRFAELAPELEKLSIELYYTQRMADLNPTRLAEFDGVMLYANIDRIADDQAQALLDYIKSGKGFIPVHSATFCWRNNAEIVALMGGQFQRHGAQVFSTEIVASNHPIMRGFSGFTSWDETYIHHLHNTKDRTVLEYRSQGDQAEGNTREPWTWVKPYGKGRVFYTAWGHDHRTWTNPGFQNLMARGIRWACNDDPQKVPAYNDPNRFVLPQMTTIPKNLSAFEYVDVGPKIPSYTPGANWGAQEKPRNMMQKPLTVEESMKHYVHPESMVLRRYADERDFQAKPIAMNWDERGRLWICETLDYPNELGQDRDRIRICEDTDGDGVADKFTIFAEGLSIPTSVVCYRGGAIVQNATETIYLKDTDDDDKADQTTVLITGWAMGDTHGGVSNLRYGLDNWIWGMQGYNYSTPQFDGPSQRANQSFSQGFWRFKLSQTDPPQVTELEFIRSSNNNTWGLGISEEGLIFGSTANGNPSMFMPIPNRYYERVNGWAPPTLNSIADNYRFQTITDKVRQVDFFGGYTAAAGHALYTARAFPQQWWNKTAFVCEPTGHLVGTFILQRDGANYTSSNPLNLLASDDEWASPIMAEVGPDGAVWVIDWYNFIIQHNPTPHGFQTGKGAAYENELRDKKHGRVYRVVAQSEGRDRLHPFEDLSKATNGQLVEALKHPSFVWRLQAQRLLVERQAANVDEALTNLVADQTVDGIGLNVSAIHALQTLDGLGRFDSKITQQSLAVIEAGLTHPSAGVRRNALAVVPKNADGQEFLIANPALFQDNDVQVRLQAILTLADLPLFEEAGKLIADLAGQASDAIVLDALTSAAAAHSISYLRAILASDKTDSNGAVQITARVAEHFARSKPNAESLQTIVAALNPASESLCQAVLEGLTQGLPSDFAMQTSENFDAALIGTFEKLNDGGKVALVRLAAKCSSPALDRYAEEIVATLFKSLADSKLDPSKRIESATQLLNFRRDDEAIVKQIISQINAQTSPEFASRLLGTLRLSESASVSGLLLRSMQELTPQSKSAALNVILSKPTWATVLLTEAENRKFDLNELTLEQKQSLRSSPNAELQKFAEKVLAMGGGLPDADREKVVHSLMHITKVAGEIDAGREVYRKTCAACHRHGEMGTAIGPELTGMAVHPKEELLTHILDPSRSVEGNFRLYNVLTVDGVVVNGMLAGETRTTITIIDSQAKEISVSRDEIEQLAASKKSVMPEGYEKQLSENELTDLLEFLTAKDRFLPVTLDRYATAISTKPLFSDSPNGPDQMIFEDWTPKKFRDIPFSLTDPRGQTVPNIILLYGPNGPLPPKMPKLVSLPCNTTANAIHFLSGVGGWSHPYDQRKTVSMIVRLTYGDGETEDHELLNGVHFADYISRNDVPESEFAFRLRGQQIRYLAIKPKRKVLIKTIDLLKGPDNSSPIIMAVTIER